MREIKFRALNPDGKGMYEVDVDFLVELKAMQFTGLHDKNGKEIYEGDILKSEGETKTQPLNFDREVHDPWWELSEVVFQEGSFKQITFAQKNSYFGELPTQPRTLFRPEEYKEVVGNIYENPELMVIE